MYYKRMRTVWLLDFVCLMGGACKEVTAASLLARRDCNEFI
jgi:hypothetical protein